MLSFNSVIHIAFLSLVSYHVVSFLVHYFSLKRIELLYYSLNLLSCAIYYLLFFDAPLMLQSSADSHTNLLNCVRITLALFQIFTYTLFTVSYLGITKNHTWIYQFFRAYFVFVPVAYTLYLTLYFLNINTELFLLVFYSTTIPVLVVYFLAILKLMTTYSNIYLVGTLLNIIGTMVSFLMANYCKDAAINHHVPAQIGLLLDLFVLNYGLSLKAAETDKKLIVSLQENQKLLEAERGRFARDLHDGLGGLLSSVKFSFSNIKENITLTAQQGLAFEQSLNKLDSGIAELRRIAHNMMPENLQQFGLNTALKDFCLTIQQGTGCNIHYECFGIENYSFNSQTDIAIYRIAQELVNNALKHAAAEQIIVQLQNSKTSTTLTVEDNGKGFDKSILKNEKGSGWKSIESRVNLLKGSCLITSSSIGTTITIDMPI